MPQLDSGQNMTSAGDADRADPTDERRDRDAVTSLTDDDWETLLENIKEGSCTPFLGAGASCPPLPAARELACKWAVEYKYPLKDNTDLSRVTQYMAVKRGEPLHPKRRIRDLFKDVPPDFKVHNRLYALLAELPLSVYVTTNYDDYMEQALKASNRTPRRELCQWNPWIRQHCPTVFFKPDQPFVPSKAEPLVFHLHGYKDYPESMVLTEDDYVDFLIAMGQTMLPPCIQRAFTEASLLFLGYGLRDWNFRVLFRTMTAFISKSQKHGHVSVQLPPREPGDSELSCRAILDYLNAYFKELDIRVFWGDCRKFAEHLETRRKQ